MSDIYVPEHPATPDATLWAMRDGTQLHVRPIEPADEPAMIRFHQSLSDDTVYSRYFSGTKLSTRILHERLRHICATNPLTEAVLIAQAIEPRGESRIVAVARLCHNEVGGDAEIALLITDAFQHRGLGAELLRRLLLLSRERGAGRVLAMFLASNAAMRRLCIGSGMDVVDSQGNESIAALALDHLPAVRSHASTV
jgi:acetyltransferase